MEQTMEKSVDELRKENVMKVLKTSAEPDKLLIEYCIEFKAIEALKIMPISEIKKEADGFDKAAENFEESLDKRCQQLRDLLSEFVVNVEKLGFTPTESGIEGGPTPPAQFLLSSMLDQVFGG